MYNDSRSQTFPEDFFSYQDMVINISILPSFGMIYCFFHQISTTICLSSFPMERIVSSIMPANKSKWLSFNPSTFYIILFYYLCFCTTSTLTQSFFNHFNLQIKRLISRLVRVVVLEPLLPLLSACFVGIKKPLTRTKFNINIIQIKSQ